MNHNHCANKANVDILGQQRPRARRMPHTRRAVQETPADSIALQQESAAMQAEGAEVQATADAAAIDIEPDPDRMFTRTLPRFAEHKDKRPGCIVLLLMVIVLAFYLMIKA